MKPIPLKLFRSTVWGTPTLIDLIEVYVSDDASPDFRFSLSDKEHELNGHIYIPVGFSRPAVRKSLNDQISSTTIVLPDVNDELSAILETSELGGARIVLRQTTEAARLRNESAVKMEARVASMTIEMSTVVMQLESLASDANGLLVVPRRTYNKECEHQFGGPWCTVNKADHQYLGVVGSGSNKLRLVDDGFNETQAARVWEPAYLRFTDGVNINQARPVAATSTGRIFLRKPFYTSPAIGDRFVLQRHCRKDIDACLAFGNSENFGGWKDQPEQPRSIVRPPIKV